MNEINPISPIAAAPVSVEVGFMHRVFGWMFAGLAITAVVSFIVSSSPALVSVFIGNQAVFIGLLVVEFFAVTFLAALAKRISAGQATAIFLLYALLNGITFSVVFLVYDIGSIGNVFMVSAGTFGIMAAYGYFTKADLTSVGNLAFMGLVGIVIASVVNVFVASARMDIVISYIGVLVFVGLTAYDVQKIKGLHAGTPSDAGSAIERKEAIVGALALYLDFVNLFLSLLRLSGKRRR